MDMAYGEHIDFTKPDCFQIAMWQCRQSDVMDVCVRVEAVFEIGP